MRVLILSNSYAPRIGGLETAVSSLAKEWQATAHQTEVTAQRHPRQLAEQEEINGIKISRRIFITPDWEQLRRKRADLFLAGLYYQFASRYWLEEKIRAFSPQIVNVHFPDSQIPFLLNARKKIPFKLVVSLHGHDVERWFEAGKKPSQKYAEFAELLQIADFVTTCSQSLLKRAKTLLPEIESKSAAILNGIDLARFEKSQAYQSEMPYLLAIGRLTFIKGFDLLLQSFAELTREIPDLQLWIAGSGEEENALKAQARNLQLESRLCFLGQVPPQEIATLLLGCRALVISSRNESFGIVALEGLAAGKPIIASRVGGLIEILQGTPNVLVEPSAQGLAEGIRSAWAADSKLIAEANQKRARQYTWNAAANKYLEIFKNVAA
jgi:glycosyltransferase involved in cell wall biosynthesis